MKSVQSSKNTNLLLYVYSSYVHPDPIYNTYFLTYQTNCILVCIYILASN